LTTAATISIEQTRQEAIDAAICWHEAGDLTPSMLTAEGADNFDPRDPKTNLGDAAWAAYHSGGSSHYDQFGGEWDDDHWDAWLDAYINTAESLLRGGG